MKSLTTAVLDELYLHITHNIGAVERMGADRDRHVIGARWVCVRRDEGSLTARLSVGRLDGESVDPDTAKDLEVTITVEKG